MNDCSAGYKILIQYYFLSKCEAIVPLPCKSNATDGKMIFIDNSLNYKDFLSLKSFKVFILDVTKHNQGMRDHHVQHSGILLMKTHVFFNSEILFFYNFFEYFLLYIYILSFFFMEFLINKYCLSKTGPFVI